MTFRWNQTKRTASYNHHNVKQHKDEDNCKIIISIAMAMMISIVKMTIMLILLLLIILLFVSLLLIILVFLLIILLSISCCPLRISSWFVEKILLWKKIQEQTYFPIIWNIYKVQKWTVLFVPGLGETLFYNRY